MVLVCEAELARDTYSFASLINISSVIIQDKRGFKFYNYNALQSILRGLGDLGQGNNYNAK